MTTDVTIKQLMANAQMPRHLRTLVKHKAMQELGIYPVLWDRITSRKVGKVADIAKWEQKIKAIINQEVSKLTGRAFNLETDMYETKICV